MFLQFLLISLGIQILLFIPAYKLKTDKLTDLSYSLTFIVIATVLLVGSDYSWTKILLFLMILSWGLRLGLYLVKRIWKIGKDKRFDEIRIDFFRFLSFWIFQGVVVPVILLPSIFFFQSKTVYSPLLLIGFFVWIAGFLLETLSDIQKYRFIENPKNKGKWVDIGFWKFSRHPNYLGEIICWLGIYIYVFMSVNQLQRIFSLISPLTISSLLLFISGIPLLENKADKKWGRDKNYQEYKKGTAVLIPFIY